MAEIEYSSMNERAGDFNFPSVGKLVNLLGAVVSVGLIAGLMWWGYQLVVRDVSGVPVVRALEGPMRVAPEDPGGELASYQGLAVNNIPAQGEAQKPADRLVLAPAPTGLEDGDQPAVAAAPPAAGDATATKPVPAPRDVPTAQPTQSAEPAPTDPVQSAGLTPPAETPTSAPAATATDDLDAAINAALSEATGASTQTAPDKPLVIVPSDLGGVTKSIVPLQRPGNLVVVAATSRDADGVASMLPSEIPAGTRLTQLGAFDSREIAVNQWRELSARFPEFMAGKVRVIEEAQSGGKLFFRLRAHGFEGLADARRFCAAFVAADQNCIPVRQR